MSRLTAHCVFCVMHVPFPWLHSGQIMAHLMTDHIPSFVMSFVMSMCCKVMPPAVLASPRTRWPAMGPVSQHVQHGERASTQHVQHVQHVQHSQHVQYVQRASTHATSLTAFALVDTFAAIP